MFTLILQRWMIWLRHSRRRAGREALAGLGVALVILLWPRPGEAVSALAEAGRGARSARIFIGGDVMLARGIDRLMAVEGAGYLFRRLGRDLIRPEDFFTFNLESPLGERGLEAESPGELRFLADPRLSVRALLSAKVDLVSLGNNHALDCGRLTLAQTLRTLAKAGIRAVGADTGANSLPQSVLIQFGATRLAVLGFNAVAADGAGSPKDAVAPLDRRAYELVRKARQQAEIVLVHVHWGVEYARRPTQRQIQQAHALIRAGAGVVIGHHPHVLQPVEEYQGGIICYSLGNLVFDQGYTLTTRGALISLTVAHGQIAAWEAIPVKIERGQPILLPPGREYAAIRSRLQWR